MNHYIDKTVINPLSKKLKHFRYDDLCGDMNAMWGKCVQLKQFGQITEKELLLVQILLNCVAHRCYCPDEFVAASDIKPGGLYKYFEMRLGQ